MAIWKKKLESSTVVAPAWHPDPSNPEQWRWWDGQQWTDRVAPKVQADPEPSPSPVAQFQWPPYGKAVPPWSSLISSQSVVGESEFGSSFGVLLQEYGHKHIPDYGVELAGAKAALVREPDNPYDPDAVAVWVDGRHQVGYLSRDDAARYAPKLDGLDKGTYLLADARVWINRDDDSRIWGSVTVVIPEPDGLLPFNDLPDVPHAVLPSGRAIQVQGEENHMDLLRRFALGSAPRHIAATLHIVETQKSEKSPKQPTVEVRIDDEPAGTLTKAMGDQLRDLVSFVNGHGRVPVVRAVIKGSTLRADVTLYVARTVDVPQRWLDSISQAS